MGGAVGARLGVDGAAVGTGLGAEDLVEAGTGAGPRAGAREDSEVSSKAAAWISRL